MKFAVLFLFDFPLLIQINFFLGWTCPLKFHLFFTKQLYAQLSDMQMRESMMSLTHYFFCFLLFELYNISIFSDLTIRTLLSEPQNVKTIEFHMFREE